MSHGRKLAVIGLGYVGLPVAVAFARQGVPVIGFDIDASRIAELEAHHDRTNEVEADDLRHPSLHLTSDAAKLAEADFYIVTVPTPIDRARRPDLAALLGASRTVGQALKQGDIVVYEVHRLSGSDRRGLRPGARSRRPASPRAAISPSAIRPSASIQVTRRTVSRPSRRLSPGRTNARSTSSQRSTARSSPPACIEPRRSRSPKPPR